MADHQQRYAESVNSEDFEDTNSQTITDEPSSDTTQATTTSSKSNRDEDNDDDGLTELVSSGGEELLAFVDEIRQIDGLDHIQLDLPQLVVVVSPDLCTHFATEIIIKRSRGRPSYKISVRDPGTNQALYTSDFPKEYTGEKWSDVYRNLKSDIEEAYSAMKRNQTSSRDGAASRADRKRRAAPLARLQEDIMTIEVAKADQAHFSVVDIPGLVSTAVISELMITDAEEADVKLSEYLAKKAVLSAVDAFDNQKVLRLVREAKANSRCLGVITKCDQVQERDDLKVLDVLKKPVHYGLNLGCYAVRNRSTKEIVDDKLSYAERDERERNFFLDKEGWQREIDPKNVGIDNLRGCLAQSLYKQVVSSFPDLREDIRNTTKAISKELKSLGDPRSTPTAQRFFLLEMQTEYQRLIGTCLLGPYLADVNDSHPSRLRNHVLRLSDDFNRVMREESLQHEFADPLKGYDPQLMIPATEELRKNILSEGGIYAWILRKWDTLRGPEPPGDPPAHLKQMLFEEQTTSWAEIAENHYVKVIQAIDDCNHFVFEKICPDVEIRLRIRERLHATESSAKSRAEEELQNLVQDQKQLLHTSDPRLNIEREDAKTTRMRMCISKVANAGAIGDGPLAEVLKTDSAFSSLVYEIHDYLKSYTGISMSRFIDNVAIQVVERHLLGRSSPLAAFTAKWIGSQTDEELELLVGEKKETQVRRAQLSKNIEVLKEAVSRAERLAYIA
ncbi:MAG: hypothetical protein Q9160_008901 [Pyrenula sp. 1 TL-2023]